jgi:hypothetical protein
MHQLGLEILKYIERNPQTTDMVAQSVAEVVPLLESEHLVLYWKFYQKLVGEGVAT